MKDYKWGKGLLFFALCGVLGAVVGGGINLVMDIFEPTAITLAFKQLTPHLVWVALICGIIGLIGYFYCNTQLKKDGYSNEEGSFFDRHENKISVVMTFSTLCAIINFTALGLNLMSDLPSIYFVCFISNVVLAFVGEVANISLIKKVRPELNADPVSPGFRKEYFDQLDELEKIQTGKASFKTISAMVSVYVSVFIICFLLIAALEVSPIICLPVGILWFMQTIMMVYYSCKQK